MTWLRRRHGESCKGFALAAAMMILALLSILGVAAIQSTTLEVQISGRDRDARLALYLAQSALEEARYYAARGWGKLTVAAGQVTVATPSPPGHSWDGNRYAGFTLLDSQGDAFTLQSHGSGAQPQLTVQGGALPSAGRFLLQKVVTAGASWSGNQLTVNDPDWAQVSGANTWSGWLLWDEAGALYEVNGSGVAPPGTPTSVVLTLSRAPASPPSGPYVLSRNPWLSALAAGAPPAGDAEPGTPAWDRVFSSASGQEIGRGRVTARLLAHGNTYGGAYELAASGHAGMSRREATLHVFHAGRPSQRARDWKVR